MAAAGGPWPILGVTFDGDADNAQFPSTHPIALLMSFLGITAGPTFDMTASTLTRLAIALARANPNNASELDLIFHGRHQLVIQSILDLISDAVAGGLVFVNPPVGNIFEKSQIVIREAMKWAQQNHSNLRILLAADFAPLANLVYTSQRFALAYSLLQVDGRFVPVVEVFGLFGWIHSAASRGNNSQFEILFTCMGGLISPPLPANTLARGLANSLVNSGLPTDLMVYPESTAAQLPCIKLRLSYTSGSAGDRREGFQLVLPAIFRLTTNLGRFLNPHNAIADAVSSYLHLVSNIHLPGQAPAATAHFHLLTVLQLDTLLGNLSHIPAQAALLVPPGDCVYMATAAVNEYLRMNTAINQSASGGSSADPTNQNAQPVQASKAYKNRVVANLKTAPWFPTCEANIIALQAANPTNHFPIIHRALQTRNVVLSQLSIGKLKGVSELSPMLGIIEGVQASFSRYVTYTICMDKIGPSTGTRQSHTLAYDFRDTWLTTLLSCGRDKFKTFPWLTVCCGIKKMRDQLTECKVTFSSSMFEASDTFAVLKELQHLLDVWHFDTMGPGSWTEAVSRLESFKLTGMGLAGEGLQNHLINVDKAFSALIDDLFDAFSHFTTNSELMQVQTLRSGRVYEVGGSYDQYLNFLSAHTANLNTLLALNPAFAYVMGGKPTQEPNGKQKGGQGPAKVGKGQGSKSSGKVKFDKGLIVFGKGDKTPSYSVKECMGVIKEIEPSLNRGNFCLSFYLSKYGHCTEGKHFKNCPQHKFPSTLKAIRAKLEKPPYRVDEHDDK